MSNSQYEQRLQRWQRKLDTLDADSAAYAKHLAAKPKPSAAKKASVGGAGKSKRRAHPWGNFELLSKQLRLPRKTAPPVAASGR